MAASLASIFTLYMTNDGLTAFKRVGGSDGAQLVPDLATSVPTPTDGGLTYTFQLRRGIRYSNGAPVRPEDFRRAIERTLALGPDRRPAGGWAYYESIVGGAACVRRPSVATSRAGSSPTTRPARSPFTSSRPDPEFPEQLAVWTAVAVPAGPRTMTSAATPCPRPGRTRSPA